MTTCRVVYLLNMQVVTHEDYLAAVATAVCEQFPATAAAFGEVQLAFGTGSRRRTVGAQHRVWSVGTAHEPLPLVEIAAIGALAPAATCHVVLHELAHVLAQGFGHGRVWRYAARQVGLLNPRAWPDAGELAAWTAIAPVLRAKLQRIPEPTEPAPADFSEDWDRRPCGAGYGSRGGTSRGAGSGSRYLKVVCQVPGCGYQVRITSKWLALGAPRCAIVGHGELGLAGTAQAGERSAGATEAEPHAQGA